MSSAPVGVAADPRPAGLAPTVAVRAVSAACCTADRDHLRVLFVDHFAGVSGAEMSMLELAAAFQERGHPVAIAAPAGGVLHDRAVALGLEFVPIYPPMLTRRNGLLANLRMLWRARSDVMAAVRTWQPAVVLANSVQAATVVALSRPGDGAFAWLWHYRYDFGPGRVGKAVVRLLAGRADAVVPISEPLVGRLTAIGVAPAKLTLIRNAIDFGRLDEAACMSVRQARAALGLPDEAPVVIVVGQLCDRKDQRAAIRVTARLRDDWPGIRLLVVGGALDEGGRAYRAELVTLTESLGLGEQVCLLGSRDDVARIMRASDVLLHPAKSEAFGRVLAEAMYMGLPVVASETSGATEVVRPGVTGLIVPVGDIERMVGAVSRLLADRSAAEAMGAAGRASVVANYSLARAAAQLEELCRRLGAQGRGAGSLA